ncbi:MAG: type II/IV secretion system protein, partial [Candidatus Omnitrophica bacterium]|nr:type II/IV secretion system protein [Candidatus Omnitrophota bacterium]
ENISLEQQLVKDGIISQEQMRTLQLEQQRSSASLVKAIRLLHFVPEETLIDFLSKRLHLEKVSLADFTPDAELISLIPGDFTKAHKVIPVAKKGNELSIGVLDPLDISLLEELRFRTGMFIKPCLVKEEELNRALAQYESSLKERPAAKVKEPAEEKIIEEGTMPSVVEAVNLLLAQGLKFNASDIHIEPQEGKIRLRLRVDGVLQEITPPESGVYNAFVSRIKIMSNLDIAEKRQPQDGRFKVSLDEGELDVRVSVIPTIQGESIVLRLLRQSKKLLTLEELGMDKENLEKYLRLIHKPSGIVLVTGPTGSGKTTTLYASLMLLKTVERNIITIEDPVEYQLDFCRQIQVNPKVNLTFATGLRSILRHDPDIIMVGEIRDLETATIAIQSALTGHLVLSTLHTNDAASAITRLIDMGIEPFLISSCLNGAVAQRLVRVLCPKCKKLASSQDIAGIADKVKGKAYQPLGCQDCLNTGYAGRIGVFEIMEMTPQVGRLTVEKASSEEVINYCRSQKMKFLYDDGWEKVGAGLTSAQELMRVLGTTG